MPPPPPPPPPPLKRQKLPSPEQVTVRKHDWAYANLQLIYDPPYDLETAVDILTWRTILTRALTQFLGITGAAIHLDILQLAGDEAWIRLPRTEMQRFAAAVSGYVGVAEGRSVGFRTIGVSEFLMGLVSKKAEASIWAQ